MTKVSLFHPFSAKAIGLINEDIVNSHSKPHERALEDLNKLEYKVKMEYLGGFLLPYILNKEGVKRVLWPISKPIFKKRHFWRKQHSLLHLLYNFLFAPDVTIINMSGHGSPYTFKLAKLLRSKNKTYIAMIGGLHMSLSGNALNYYQNADHIIVHTEGQKKKLHECPGFENIKINVMPLGVDTSVFKPDPIKTNTGVNLLYVGRITPLKQIEILIETIDLIVKSGGDNTRLTIIGPISDKSYYSYIKKLIRKSNLKDNVIFKGVVKQIELIPYYQEANLFLFPSSHESFGMVMIEAMACGTGVVALEGSGGPDEVISNGIDGILTTKKQFAEEVLMLLKNKILLNRISKQARNTVLSYYSQEVTNRVLRESVESALKM